MAPGSYYRVLRRLFHDSDASISSDESDSALPLQRHRPPPSSRHGMRVVEALFHRRGPGDKLALSWRKFKKMMAELGFEGPTSDGAYYTFCPTDSARKRGWTTAVTLYKPDQGDGITIETARKWGQELNRQYGWSFRTFKE